MTDDIEVHPLAAVWPMLNETDLHRLADDIAKNGQLHPILLDLDGRLIDGRNRLAACRIAGVEPHFSTFEGDPTALILSAEERRHLTTGQRAMGTALILTADGKRKGGKWAYGALKNLNGQESDRSGWGNAMAQAGLVLDHAPDLASQVVAGSLALDAAYKTALANKETAKLRAGLAADLGALVDAGVLPLTDALRRALLPEMYQAKVSAEELTLRDAEALAARDAAEHKDAVRRKTGGIVAFLSGWDIASRLLKDPTRTEVLDSLDDHDRDRFINIEKRIQ